MRKKILKLALFAAAASLPAVASAQTLTLPAFNGDGNLGAVTIGTFTFDAGQTFTTAIFQGFFGNSEVSSSAEGYLTLDGITIGTCPSTGPCQAGPGLPIHYEFSPSEFSIFADGSATLVYNQTGCCIIRLAESTLTLRAVEGSVPEPATWAMMLIGFGAIGGSLRHRRRTQNLLRAC